MAGRVGENVPRVRSIGLRTPSGVAGLGHGRRHRAPGPGAPVDPRLRAAHDPTRPARPSRSAGRRPDDGGDRAPRNRGGRGPGPPPRVPLGAERRARRGLLPGPRRAEFLPERRHPGLRARLRRGSRARAVPRRPRRRRLHDDLARQALLRGDRGDRAGARWTRSRRRAPDACKY